ncbi:MAG: rhodanese-like domain-containing protein [Lachnospirales bacterium]
MAIKKIGYEELIELLKKNVKLLDVRDIEEYNRGHIKGAVNIPLENLEKSVGKFVGINDHVVVYCQMGGRANLACILLNSLGYKNIYNFGSLDNWKETLLK